MRMRSFGKWAPYALGIIALGCLVLGLFSDNQEMVVLGSVAAAALFVGFPLAEWFMWRDDDSEI